jgi:hypothetical protein
VKDCRVRELEAVLTVPAPLRIAEVCINWKYDYGEFCEERVSDWARAEKRAPVERPTPEEARASSARMMLAFAIRDRDSLEPLDGDLSGYGSVALLASKGPCIVLTAGGQELTPFDPESSESLPYREVALSLVAAGELARDGTGSGDGRYTLTQKGLESARALSSDETRRAKTDVFLATMDGRHRCPEGPRR